MKGWLGYRTSPLVFLAVVVGTCCPSVLAQQTSHSGKSWTDAVTTPFKQGYEKVSGALNPKMPPPEDDAVSLKNRGKAGPDLHVAVARLYMQSNKFSEAEQQYQVAIKAYPNDLSVLLGYAELKERMGKPDQAIQLYQHAAKLHPQQAAVYNNLGLCLARQNRLNDAVAAMGRAVQLEPRNPLYRNNIAAILVDQGKSREAFVYLREVHGAAAAHYNLGYLLNKKGQTQPALQHFVMAAKADPSMAAAQQWVNYLEKAEAQARLPQHPIANGVKITSKARAIQDDEMAIPSEPTARRLPPTSGVGETSRTTLVIGNRPARASNTAVQPLPSVR